MPIVITKPTPNDPATSGTWGTTINTALDTIVAGVNAMGLAWTAVKTAAYTAVIGDAVLCDTSAGTFPVTLPAVSNAANGRVRVKWRAGTNPPSIVAANGRTLDPTWAAVGFGQVGDSADFSDDGTVWNLI